MSRRVLVGLALVLGLGLSGVLGWVGRRRTTIAPDAVVAASVADELELATGQGLVVAEEGVLTEPELRRTFTLEPGECIAVVAASGRPSSLFVRLDVASLAPMATADTAHLAACTTAAGPAEVLVRREAFDAFDDSVTTHFAILRGHVRDPRTYTRLTSTQEQREAFDASVVRARAALVVPESARIAEERLADRDHAVLFPASRASFAALRALTGRIDLAPRVIDAQASADPFASATDVHTPPRVFTGEGRERAIAVVDAGALGAPCVTVALVRLDDATTAEPIHRESIPDARVTALEATDPAITIDRICPARGLFVYTVDEARGGDTYAVSVSRLDADPAAVAEPSHFGDAVGGHHPSSGLVTLPVAMVATSRASCATGDAEACLVLASLARDRIQDAGTVREALEPLCVASGGTVCDVLAGAIAESAALDADRFERRACVTGEGDACMRRGARFLAGASDLSAALRTFRYGCAHACADCCTAVSTMREWELAPGDAPAAEPDEPG